MNGTDLKKAAINRAKQVAGAANGNGNKKRKGQNLQPIITSEGTKSSTEGSPASASALHG